MSTITPDTIDPLLSIEQRVDGVRDSVLFLAAQAEILDRHDTLRQLRAIKAELILIKGDVHVALTQRALLRRQASDLAHHG